MKHHNHQQHYTPEKTMSPFWAIFTLLAAATTIILMALHTARVLIK